MSSLTSKSAVIDAMIRCRPCFKNSSGLSCCKVYTVEGKFKDRRLQELVRHLQVTNVNTAVGANNSMMNVNSSAEPVGVMEKKADRPSRDKTRVISCSAIGSRKGCWT